jgi:hypothetical protein
MMALMMAFVLVSAAFLGLALIPGTIAAPGDIDDPFPNDDILEGAGVDMDKVYTTSDVTVAINYSLKAEAVDFYPVELTVKVTDGGSVWELYRWEEGDGAIANPYNWDMNLTTPGDYTITVRAVYYYTVDTDYWFDTIDLDFALVDGTDMIGEVMANKDAVLNDGADSIDIYFMVHRAPSEIMDVQFNIYNEWLVLAGGDGFVFSPNLTAADLTITPEGDHTNVSYTWDVPMGMLAGYISAPYDVVVNGTDNWGYNQEVYQDDLFDVVWMELPPYMTDGEIEFEEDSYAVVDLDDHFEDINGDSVNYYINLSALENLMIVWVDDHTINITAPADWNGIEEVPVWFNDSKNPDENDTITITVTPTEDPLMQSMENKVMVDEHLAMATFDPRAFFYDPDAEVTANLTISLGWDWAKNETNVSYMKPIWMLEEENFTVMINSTDQANSKAMLTADLEEGSWDFQVSAWFDGEFVMNGTAMFEIVPVNDVPMLIVEEIVVYRNRSKTVNLSALFDDADGPEFNVTVNTTVSGALLTYDWETFMLTINPARNWTGSINVELNVTDSIDFALVTLPIEVMLMAYEISGTIMIDEGDLNLTLENITLTIGGQAVAFNTTTGAYSIVLDELGDYAVIIEIEEEFLYDEAAEKDGYVVPTIGNILLMDNEVLDITIEWMEYVPTTPMATWDDIDFENWKIDEDDDLVIVTVPVLNESLEGYGDIIVILVIIVDDEEELEFPMTWDNTDMVYVVELDEDELENVSEGDVDFYFKGAGDEKTNNYSGEFKEKDENANLITVIVLIILIILVLIALVFIMRKPSEEEFDEEEEEEEEEGERTCPSCGETVTDEEAEECPYCGEDLEE